MCLTTSTFGKFALTLDGPIANNLKLSMSDFIVNVISSEATNYTKLYYFC